MAALEAGASWLAASGLLGFFVVLVLLSVFLTALCSDCGRRSFELQEPEEKNPSSLIRVVRLEEVARENPMINEIRNDEKDFNPGEENAASFTPWRSHLAAPQNHQDVQTNGSAAVMKMTRESETAGEAVSAEEETSVTFTPWRSHLRPQEDVNDPNHIYHVIGGGRDANMSSPATNQEAGEEPSDDTSSVYARVSKKVRTTTAPAYTPEEVQVDEEEESSPPLPDRKEMEG